MVKEYAKKKLKYNTTNTLTQNNSTRNATKDRIQNEIQQNNQAIRGIPTVNLQELPS